MEPQVLLTLETPATDIPIDREEIRRQLRIVYGIDNELLDANVAAACEYVENQSGYAVLSQTWKASFACTPSDRLYLPKYPVTAITSIDYFDVDNVAQTLTTTGFTLYDSGFEAWLQPNQGIYWPSVYDRPDALSVTFSVGGGFDRYRTLRQAALMIAADWYEQPTASSEMKKMEVPFGASQLINQNRRQWIG